MLTKHWTDNELSEALRGLTVITDTREQSNQHVTEWFSEKSIPCVRRKLDVGDYSAMLGDRTLEQAVVLERKGSLDELCMNLTSDRDRFEREFLRAKANGIRVFLLIEDASMNDVFLGNYRSKISPQSLTASLLSWTVRYDVCLLFCSKQNAGRLITQVLFYAMREELLHGNC